MKMNPTTIADTHVEQLQERIAELQATIHRGRSRLRSRLELAATVHRSLLPKPIHHDRLDVDVRYIPIEEVGGDYCQVRFTDPETCYVTISDVTGHGIGPALLATRVSSEVRFGILAGHPPREIVRSLNQFICDHFDETGLYLTFVAARIDLRRRTITYSGAGHPSPLIIRRRSLSAERLPSQNAIVGVQIEWEEEVTEQTVELEPGDRLLFYTDGVTETVNRYDHELGTAGLATVATEMMSVGLFEVADKILDRVSDYQFGPTVDDKTLIVAEVR